MVSVGHSTVYDYEFLNIFRPFKMSGVFRFSVRVNVIFNMQVIFGYIICRCLCLFITTEPLEDPYLMDEEDPVECRALESSLWEIKVCTACDHFGFSNESSMAPTTTVTNVSQGFCHVDFENELKEYHTLYGAALFFFFHPADAAETPPSRCGQSCDDDQQAPAGTRGWHQRGAGDNYIWGDVTPSIFTDFLICF